MSYDAYDPALQRLSPYSDTLTNFLTNHAPMVVETLCALGRGDAVDDWLTRYLEGAQAKPDAVSPIDAADWQSALGQPNRSTDWRLFFEAQIGEQGWQDVLATWAVRLTPGLCGAAAHGIIRTGHAVRGLEQGVSTPRLNELAEGLALWAASYQTLPAAEDEGTAKRFCDPVEALAHVDLLPEAMRKNNGSIVMGLMQLDQFESFGPVIHLLDASGAQDEVIDRLAIALADLFRAQAHNFLYGIVFCHALTALAAILRIGPYLQPDQAKRMLAYGWQTGCGLYAVYANQPAPNPYADLAPETPDAIVAQAVANGDDHVIKLSETCLLFHQRTGADVFLTVPAHMRHIAV